MWLPIWVGLACTAPSPEQDSVPAVTGGTTSTGSTTTTSTGTGTTSTPGVAALQLGATPRNILFLSIDTLRFDHIGYFGGGPDTPFLDTLLDRSIVLGDHRSCSNWTGGSFLCLLSGQTTVDLGFEWNTMDDRADPEPKYVPLLPDWLRAEGIRTLGVSANPFLSTTELLGRGYDELLYPATGLPGVYPSGATITDLVLEQLDVWRLEGGAPWYLHVHYMDPHTPPDAPHEYYQGIEALEPIGYDLFDPSETARMEGDWPRLDDATRALVLEHIEVYYRGDIRRGDDEIKRLWWALDSRGLLEDTLVVFATDHGEQLLERMKYGHAESLHAEENRALLAFWSADLLQSGDYGGRTAHQDLTPTLFHALGLAQRPEFTGFVVGTEAPDRPRFSFRYEEGKAPVSGLDVGTDRLVLWWDSRTMLYDTTVDPLELTAVEDDLTTTTLLGVLQPELERIQAYLPFLSW